MADSLCDSCKRQGRVWCPHRAAELIRQRMLPKLSQDMFGPSPPMLFVGHSFYPNVYWGPLVSSESTLDDPRQMYGMGLEKIIELRASMVRGMKRSGVKDGGKMLDEAQMAVMSIKPVDAETRFSKKPVFSLEFDSVAHPVGARAPIEKFTLADNAVVPKKVDEQVEEEGLASDAVSELLLEGFDVHYLSKLLASGILGRDEGRRLVPTKWAITATDDIAAKQYMESIRHCGGIGEPLVYSNSYLGNHFQVLLLPGNWEYEQFETALTTKLERFQRMRKEKQELSGLDDRAKLTYREAAWEDWKYDGAVNISEEHEPFAGRSKYAQRQGGGYYAARFAVAEALYKMKRQARVVVFREIGTQYCVPVGVWEVRENVRHAFENEPLRFGSPEAAFAHLRRELAVPFREYVKLSKVLLQRRITDF